MTPDRLHQFIDRMANGILPAYGYLQMAKNKGVMDSPDIQRSLESCERTVAAIREMRKEVNEEGV